MVLGLEWGEFGVWVCGELFSVAEFYEESEVYCGAAGYDCALVCCYGDCEFDFFFCCSGCMSSLSLYFLFRELEGRSLGHLLNYIKGLDSILHIPMCTRHLEELATSTIPCSVVQARWPLYIILYHLWSSITCYGLP